MDVDLMCTQTPDGMTACVCVCARVTGLLFYRIVAVSLFWPLATEPSPKTLTRECIPQHNEDCAETKDQGPRTVGVMLIQTCGASLDRLSKDLHQTQGRKDTK